MVMQFPHFPHEKGKICVMRRLSHTHSHTSHVCTSTGVGVVSPGYFQNGVKRFIKKGYLTSLKQKQLQQNHSYKVTHIISLTPFTLKLIPSTIIRLWIRLYSLHYSQIPSSSPHMMRPHNETIMLRKMNAKEDVIKKGYLYTVSLNPLSYMTPPERRVGWIMGI